jgi:hypothetical protein
LVGKVWEHTCQDGSYYSYNAYCNADEELEMMQQYRNIVGSIDQIDNLVKSEVDTPCQGRVPNLLEPCTESEAKRLMGYIYDKDEISIRHEVADAGIVATNLFDDTVSMDDDQINVMIMISCEQCAELKNLLECKVFNLLEAVIVNMKKSRFDMFLSRCYIDGFVNLTVYFDVEVVVLFFLSYLLLWLICCFKFVIREG